MLIGPFDLLVDVPCAFLGVIIGAGAMAVAVFLSAGQPSAIDDRNSLIALLKEFGLSDKSAVDVLKRGINKWAQWRWKLRPLLWRYGRDWPEHGQVSEQELEDYYFSLIPPPPPSFAPSSMPEEQQAELQASGAEDSLDTSMVEDYQRSGESGNAPESE